MSPNTPAHHPPRSELPPPDPHPSANKYTDKSSPARAASPKPADNAHAAHSAYTDHKPRRSPAPRSTQFPASADPHTSPKQTPAGSAAHPNPHCEKSIPRHFPPPAAPPPKTSAHARDAEVPLAKAQSDRGSFGTN